ncbi:MAG: protein-L-isoaspartate(D-aspartate) O-methyltransferase [Phycisphaerae bacterium]|nr:protein-L-isoaspartate(D-aspartate) O-methyltransferase [Phycisphaerae bacterium]
MAVNPEKLAKDKEKMLRFDLKGRDIIDTKVLTAMEKIPREVFISENYADQTYFDCPLPIGCGQTISQPYIVALMTQSLRLDETCEVLEIGTGCGYQTAILAEIAKKVYTIERFNELSESAQAAIGKLGCTNIEFAVGDGSCGWPQERTFDRIILTAAAPRLPDELAGQLREGGIIVAPVGGEYVQYLMRYEKRGGKIIETSICGCRFVKMLGKCGWPE